MFFYTYVLKSLYNSNLYIGWTNNLVKRLTEHNQRKIRATRSRTPFNLIYYEACLSKKDAVKREKAFKTGFGRAYLKRRLSY